MTDEIDRLINLPDPDLAARVAVSLVRRDRFKIKIPVCLIICHAGIPADAARAQERPAAAKIIGLLDRHDTDAAQAALHGVIIQKDLRHMVVVRFQRGEPPVELSQHVIRHILPETTHITN